MHRLFRTQINEPLHSTGAIAAAGNKLLDDDCLSEDSNASQKKTVLINTNDSGSKQPSFKMSFPEAEHLPMSFFTPSLEG